MRLIKKVNFAADVFGDRVEVEVPLLGQIIILLLVIYNLTGEEFHHVAESYFVALVRVQYVQEIIGLLIQILLKVRILCSPVGRDVRNLEVHSRVEVNKLRI